MFRSMLLFWLGFFALVALLLVLDLGVLHRKQAEPSMAGALGWTIVWVLIGLSFSGVVYLMYENHWNGVDLVGCQGPPGHTGDGTDAAVTYVSAYLLEQALSVDNLFVMAMAFKAFRIPLKYQHRVLFWGILGAICFRLVMLGGGAYIAQKFEIIFYIFGAFLLWKGFELLRGGGDDEEKHPERSVAVRWLRKFVRIIQGEYDGHFHVRVDGKLWFTTTAVCLVVIELQDIVFAADSIPAVLSVSRDTFVMVTSNIFAVLGLRSLYFVLAGAMAKFQYLGYSLGVLLVLIGLKMILGTADIYDASHVVTLGAIAVILAAGVIASVIATKRAARTAATADGSVP